PPGALPVLQTGVHFSDPRSLVLEGEAQPDPLALRRRVCTHRAAAAVIHGVARQLTGRRHDLRLVHQAEPQLDRQRPHQLADQHDVLRRPHRSRLLVRHDAPFGAPWSEVRSSSIPLSTFRAVRTPGSESPSSTSVMATAGCMPTTTVSASSTRDMAAMLPIMRPMNESTTSSEEMSMSTPREWCLTIWFVRSSCRVMATRSGTAHC